jgi:hypothetical protein
MSNLQTENSQKISPQSDTEQPQGEKASQRDGRPKFRNIVFKYENQGKTMSGIPIPLVTITDFARSN